MQWLRNWFRRPRGDRALSVRRSYRPELDALEDRRLMNVSSIFNSLGVLTTYVVDQPGKLTRIDNHGAHVLNVRPSLPTGVTVRVAHGYLDAKGKAAVDVLFTDGQAWQSDFRGAHFVAGNVLNMSTVVTKTGIKNFFLFADAGTGSPPFGTDLTGTLVVNFHGVNTTLDTKIRWVNTFVDASGRLGLIRGKILASGNLVVTKTIGAAVRTMYNSPDGATQDLTDYSQTTSNGQTVFDVTFGRFAGTYALHFRGSVGIMFGDGASIKAGG